MQIDINRRSFSKLVEDYLIRHKDVDYMEAIIEVCDAHAVDVRDCKSLLTKEIIQRIEVEARNSNLIEGGNPSYALPL
jgi:hypothetical protein